MNRLFRNNDDSRPVHALLSRVRLPEGPASVSSIVDTPDDLIDELARARRYERALALAVVSAKPLQDASGPTAAGGAGGATIETTLPRVVSLLAAAALRQMVRQSDVVCYRPLPDDFLLALAETSHEAARDAVDRISEVLASHHRLRIDVGIAHYPADALTLDDLIERAGASVSRQRRSRRDADPPGPRNGDGPSSNGHRRTPSRTDGR